VDTTIATGEGSSIGSSAASTNIGNDPNAAGYSLDGTIDQVMISNVARSAGWILASYNNEVAPVCVTPATCFLQAGTEQSNASVSPTMLPTGYVGVSYGPFGPVAITGRGFAGTITWSLVSGTAPPGVVGSCITGITGNQCLFSGTPTTTTGSPFSLTIRATDGNTTIDTPYTITIAAAPTTQLSFLGATSTQALVRVSGSCAAIQVSETPQGTPINDFDPAQYTGANSCAGRSDTFSMADGSQVVTIGHMRGNRSLGLMTAYYMLVDGRPLTFSTANLSMGSTVAWPVPANAANWANRDYPLQPSDLVNKNVHYDPLTGLKLRLASNAQDWTALNPRTSGTTVFRYFQQASGSWTAPGSVLSGPSSTATTSTTDPLDVYPGCGTFTGTDPNIGCDLKDLGNSNQYYPYNQYSLNDIGVALWGSGTDNTSQNNRNFTVCVFNHPADGCLGTPITIQPIFNASGTTPPIPSGSSDPDGVFPAKFPKAMFAGWGTNVFVGVENRVTSGTLTASAGVLTINNPPASPTTVANPAGGFSIFAHFSPDTKIGDKIFVQGSSPTCVNNLCTVASIQSAKVLTVSESITFSANTPFVQVGWGIRIAKANNTGSITVGASYKIAASINANQSGAEMVKCPAGTFSTGDSPPKQARWCSMTSSGSGINLWYFLMTDGTSRQFWTGVIPAASYFTTATTAIPPGLGWDAADVPGGSTLQSFRYAPGLDGRTWYVEGPNSAGTRDLYQLTYRGDTTENRDPAYSMAVDTSSYVQIPPNDKIDWTLILDHTNTLVSQITTRFPSYNQAIYTTNFQLLGISGDTAYYENKYATGGAEYGAWIAVLDLPSKILVNMIHTVDGSGTAGHIRFGGYHNGTVTSVANTLQITNNLLNRGGNYLHAGPFLMPITHLMRSGAWNTDTCLDWPVGTGTTCANQVYDSTCPSGNPYESLGAIGARCVALSVPAGGWCNISPRSDELSTWPCPTPGASITGWTPASYAQPFPVQLGDMFVQENFPPPYNGSPGDNENFRVVQITPGAGPNGGTKIVAQRNSMPDVCCVAGATADGPILGATCGQDPKQAQHATGWWALATSSRVNGCNVGVFEVTGKAEKDVKVGDVGPSLQGHGDLAPGVMPANVTFFSAKSSIVEAPLENLFTLPLKLNTLSSPQFAGQGLPIGSGVQSYAVAPGGTPWFTDSNTANGGGGCCREGFGGIGISRDLNPVSGTIYTIEVGGSLNYKLSPLIAWAGARNLVDVSGPNSASALASTPFSVCLPLIASECVTGSSTTATGSHGLPLAYINVPMAYEDPSHQCFANQHWANVPCVVSGWPGFGAFRQEGWTRSDPDSRESRFLTYLMDVPGSQYPYNTFWPLGDKVAWGPPTFLAGWGQVTWMTELPPWVTQSNPVNSTGGGLVVNIPSGPAYAEIQFGYSRFGGTPSQFRCTPRSEACNTSGTPLNFEFETRAPTACASGCTMKIPAIGPNIMYYRVRRSADPAFATGVTNGEMQAVAVR
jgi:hypothetical protein